MQDLLCPKCQVPMRVIERSGVTIERCPQCGGVFLDQGELERLEQAETAYIAANPRGYGGYRDYDDDDDDRYRSREHGGGHGGAVRYDEHGRPVRRRRGFLGELLDFGGD